MEVILNDLSLRVLSPSQAEAERRMGELVSLLRSLYGLGCERVLRTPRWFYMSELAVGYRLAKWLDALDRDTRQLVKSVAAKMPLIEVELETIEREGGCRYAFRCEREAAAGLGLAYLLDGLAVSLQGDLRYECDPANLDLDAVDAAGRPFSEAVEVCNLSRPDQVALRASWITETCAPHATSGEELWQARERLLPGLVFCVEAERQLRSLSGVERGYRQIVRHLTAISSSLLTWRDGAYEPAAVTWSVESPETLRHPVHGPKRIFTFPTGERVKFSHHTKPTGEAKRIYFVARSEPQRVVYIGYIGPHLSSVLYPHFA